MTAVFSCHTCEQERPEAEEFTHELTGKKLCITCVRLAVQAAAIAARGQKTLEELTA